MWYRYMVQSRCLYQTRPTGTGKSQKVTCPSPILSFFHSFSPNLKTPLSQSHPVPPNLKTSRSQSPLSHPIRRPPCHSPTCPNLSHKWDHFSFFLSLVWKTQANHRTTRPWIPYFRLRPTLITRELVLGTTRNFSRFSIPLFLIIYTQF